MDGMDSGAAASGGGDRLEQVEKQQRELIRTVRELAATVKRLGEARPFGGRGPGPVNRDDLVGWVSWLADRYQLDIPACWPRHGSIVEELAALRIGWLDTIASGQGGLAGTQWHDALMRVVDRIDNTTPVT